MSSSSSFPPHDAISTFDFPKQEEKVLAFWKQIDAFKTSLNLSEGQPEFSFYDGPPFATGLPHYGHLLAGTVKDIITRHASSTGFHVTRRFGWDTHGLPVEHEIDKKLNITGKNDVMAMGISKYNQECRNIVMRYSSEWRKTVERMGRWIDFDNDYKTLNASYMDSVWWVFRQLFDKGVVYRGTRVMPYSTGCTTPLSNFEADQDYQEVTSPAVVVSFPLVNDRETSLLAWTTTPYTLPSNLALCVHPDYTYVKILDLDRNQKFIIHEKLLVTLFKDPKKAKYKILDRLQGIDIVGWRYIPPFDYFTEQFEDRSFKVVADTYVSDTAGTGIVHQAPGFGADDHRVALSSGILLPDEMPPCPIDEVGRFTAEIPDFVGVYVKDADKEIQKRLKSKGILVVQSTTRHRTPFCWRSKTQLLYRAIPSWFVRVQDIAGELMSNNDKTRWVPQSVGDGRFGNWLANARDWNISRNRYWGTPIPLWVSEDYEEIVCVGSIAELERLSGVKGITDIHRDRIDDITIPSRSGKGVLRRVSEVFDCWFESGSMPYAQIHYPFENKEKFERTFPADFVSEGIDQTRGWFYTLLVLSTHLFGTAPWKNLIVTGLVLAEDGKKMSKSLRNYPDPNDILDKYGADATRMFLVNSPVVRGDNLRFREEGPREVVSKVLLPWLNAFRFFLGQVSLLQKTNPDIRFVYNKQATLSNNVMDRWILARCQSLIILVKEEMAAYRLYTVIPRLLGLIDELTNWYVRFNRRRLKGEGGVQDTLVAFNTLFETLYTLCLTMSSYTPFFTENIYQTLRTFIPPTINSDGKEVDTRSIHFLRFPEVKEEYFDPEVQRQVGRMQVVIELTRTLRERHSISLKTPLKELLIFHANEEYLSDIRSLETYIRGELNVRNVVYTSDEDACGIRYRATADWSVLGKKLRSNLGIVKKALPGLSSEEVKRYASTGKITVDGIDLVEGDLTVSRFMEVSEPEVVDGESNRGGVKGNFATHTDGDVVVRLDTHLYPELTTEWLARELVNRLQKLRKKAGLQPTDDVNSFIDFGSGGEGQDESGSQIKEAIEAHKELILKTAGSVPVPVQVKSSGVKGSDKLIIQEEQEINGDKFFLSLAYP